MVTSATIRHSDPRPAPPTITWPRPAAILVPDGASLSEVVLLGSPHDGRLLFGEVNEPAALLDYYFGIGGRRITIHVDGCVVRGWLETRWEGSHRTWWLELDA